MDKRVFPRYYKNMAIVLFVMLALTAFYLLISSLAEPHYCTTQAVVVREFPDHAGAENIEALGHVADLPAGKSVYLSVDTTPAFWMLIRFWDGLEIKQGWIGTGNVDICQKPVLNASLFISGLGLVLIGLVGLATW